MRKGAILQWLLLAAISFAAISMGKRTNPEGKVSEQVLINTKKFADAQNSSCLPISGRLRGGVQWRKPTIIAVEPLPAENLAISGSNLVIRYHHGVDVRDRRTGESLWFQELLANYTFDLKEKGLVTVDAVGYYQLLGTDKKMTMKLSLPFLGPNTVLYLSQEIGDEIYYCYTTRPTPTNRPGDMVLGPNLQFSRLNTKNEDFVWQFERQENVVDALMTRDCANFLIATAGRLYLFGADTKSNDAVKTIQLEKFISCSYDLQGNILVVESRKEDTVLKKLDPEGNLLWEYSFGLLPVGIQPPATAPDGAVYLAAGNRLLRIKDGKEVWSNPIPDNTLLTVFQDGSVLIAAGTILSQVSDLGQEIKTIAVEDSITCRPIMDENGLIYIAGKNLIICLN